MTRRYPTLDDPVILRPYKFLVSAVVQVIEDDRVVDERETEPMIVFGCDRLEEWARAFPEAIQTAKDGNHEAGQAMSATPGELHPGRHLADGPT